MDLFIVGVISLIGLAILSSIFWVGVKFGKVLMSQKFAELRRQPIAGQTIHVRGIGDVFILGFGDDPDDGSTYVDYIESRFLEGTDSPGELSDELLERDTVSVPLDNFVAQCDYVKAAKLFPDDPTESIMERVF
jgi:hypothetical protein